MKRITKYKIIGRKIKGYTYNNVVVMIYDHTYELYNDIIGKNDKVSIYVDGLTVHVLSITHQDRHTDVCYFAYNLSHTIAFRKDDHGNRFAMSMPVRWYAFGAPTGSDRIKSELGPRWKSVKQETLIKRIEKKSARWE